MTTPSNQTPQPSPPPDGLIDPIEKEAQAIWHITELLSKLGPSSCPDLSSEASTDAEAMVDSLAEAGDTITLSTDALRHFCHEIDHKLNNIMEHIERLDVRDPCAVNREP